MDKASRTLHLLWAFADRRELTIYPMAILFTFANAGKMHALCGGLENVQRVSIGSSTLIQHISELEEWDAILLRGLFFDNEFSHMDKGP